MSISFNLSEWKLTKSQLLSLLENVKDDDIILLGCSVSRGRGTSGSTYTSSIDISNPSNSEELVSYFTCDEEVDQFDEDEVQQVIKEKYEDKLNNIWILEVSGEEDWYS